MFITLAALAVAGGIAAFLNRAPPSAISAEVGPRLNPQAQEYARRLVNEPCNHTLAIKLVTTLLKQAEYAELISFVQKTTAKCGQIEELLGPMFLAQMRSSDFAGAEQNVNKLLAEYPADPQMYAYRSQTREKRGDFAGAYADMRAALSLFADPSDVVLSVYDDVARLADKTGHPCDAVATLRDYIAFDPENRRTQQITTVMATWQQRGFCPSLSGVGRAFVRFAPPGPIFVSVKVNGVSSRMVVDTGATRVFLTREFAKRAGIETPDAQLMPIATADGYTLVYGGRADSVSVDAARLNSVPVFIQTPVSKPLGQGIDGLLGESFLGNFRTVTDPRAGTLEIRPID